MKIDTFGGHGGRQRRGGMSAAATARVEGRHDKAQVVSTTVLTSTTTASGGSGSDGEEARTGQQVTATTHDERQHRAASAPTPAWECEGVDELVNSMRTTTLKLAGRRWTHTPSNGTQLIAYHELKRALVTPRRQHCGRLLRRHRHCTLMTGCAP